MRIEKIIELYGNGVTLEEALKERGPEEDFSSLESMIVTEEEKERLRSNPISYTRHNIPRELLEEDGDVFDA